MKMLGRGQRRLSSDSARGDEEKVWGSMVKQTLKRRRPDFSESSHGYRSFTELLKDAEARGIVKLELDEKSGGYIVTSIADAT